LKFLIALPMPRPRPGRRFAPKITMTISRTTTSSGNPIRGIRVLLRLAQIVPLFVAAPLVSLATTPYAQFTSGVNLVERGGELSGRPGRARTGGSRGFYFGP